MGYKIISDRISLISYNLYYYLQVIEFKNEIILKFIDPVLRKAIVTVYQKIIDENNNKFIEFEIVFRFSLLKTNYLKLILRFLRIQISNKEFETLKFKIRSGFYRRIILRTNIENLNNDKYFEFSNFKCKYDYFIHASIETELLKEYIDDQIIFINNFSHDIYGNISNSKLTSEISRLKLLKNLIGSTIKLQNYLKKEIRKLTDLYIYEYSFY